MYSAQKFLIPSIEGISQKQIDIHLGLYEGYIAHVNTVYKTLEALSEKEKESTYALAEVRRRLSFELAGVINHEIYFDALVGGGNELWEGTFKEALNKQFNSIDGVKEKIRSVALTTRGIGWVILTYDTTRSLFHILFVSDHEVGGVSHPTLLALDMWEHAFMVDYTPSEKKKYVDAYLSALNWNRIAARFEALL